MSSPVHKRRVRFTDFLQHPVETFTRGILDGHFGIQVVGLPRPHSKQQKDTEEDHCADGRDHHDFDKREASLIGLRFHRYSL